MTETEAALAQSRHLRCTLEETAGLIKKLDDTRSHMAILLDDLLYRAAELKERQELQSVALGLLERFINNSNKGAPI